MRIIFSEYPADYSQYHFPYQVMAVMEKKDNLPELYSKGWLPFRSKKRLFYLSRGTRVRLNQFQLSSENRRILRKVEDIQFSVQPVEQFTYTPEIQKFCKQFADAKFGDGVMPTAAIRALFSDQANTTHIITFTSSDNDQPIGYVATIIHDHFLHYAHPFYNLEIDNPSLGMGMMVKMVDWAKQQTKQFAYLGTCYTKSSLYKTQFSGFEFYNGWQWSDDKEELKFLVNRDNQQHLANDPQYREQFLENNLQTITDEKGMAVRLK